MSEQVCMSDARQTCVWFSLLLILAKNYLYNTVFN